MEIPKDLKDEIEGSISHCRDCFYDSEIDLEDWFIPFREYLESIDCPEKYYKDIDGKIECRFCGSKISIDDDIVLPTEDEEKYDEMCEIIENMYKKQLDDFNIYLEKYPYLGMHHDVGQQIKRDIKSIRLETINNQVWHRARNLKDGRILHQKDMSAPDNDKIKIGEGRFNHYGQSVFYLGNTENVCIREILERKNDMCWMQKIEIVKLDSILNLSHLFAPDLPEIDSLVFSSINYTGIINKSVKKDKSWKPEYFIPRFIADTAKEIGIKAIIYKSSVDYGNNIVIFNWKQVELKYIGNPYLYKYIKEKVLF
jgi:hypothetical protein